ncbi:MAG TPA: FAD-dependent monooxygenase [Rhodocyclaceae bacterium]|nr:FAD-dependent monooxygenase [Rhodocyclaceae bacterium]
MIQTDIAIAGGGAAGLALALALHKHGQQAQVFDAGTAEAGRADKRILALSHGSMQCLDWLGVWTKLATKSAPITTIHVSQRGGLGRTRITAQEQKVPALGYVCPAAELVAALQDAAANAGITVHRQSRVANAEIDNDAVRFQAGERAFSAKLLAYAEGTVDDGPHLRTRDYDQHAITCTATLTVPHHGWAWERFTSHGPVALLPVDGGVDSAREVAVVYTCPAEAAADLQALDDATFAARLESEFNGRVSVEAVTQRHRFPLGLRYRDTTTGPRQVWLGNAAQTLHPVAGQGYNLALRDIRDLACSLAGTMDPGAQEGLAHYAARRRIDRRSTIGFTDGLVHLFSNDQSLLGHARGAGLFALDLLPPLRGFVADRMMFGARAW